MILQALKGYYDRAAILAPGEISPIGYSEQKIGFTVILALDGSVVDIRDERVQDGRRMSPITMVVPAPPKRSGRNPPPAFLWDKTSYAFGTERDDVDKDKLVENPEYHRAFRGYHEELLKGTTDPGLLAVLGFLKSWQPAHYSGIRYAKEMLDANVVFQLDGERGWLHDRSAARELWSAANLAASGVRGPCLVTGEEAPIARLHASIKGVRDAQQAGASIVSFNQDSFVSYGKVQGDNAPVSEAAVFAYTTALNSLISRTSGRDTRDRPRYRNRVQIADATTVFWAEGETPAEAQSNDAFLLSCFNDDSAEDENSVIAKLAAAMGEIADGRPLAEVLPDLKPETQFYVLGLSPNAARISVRFWHQSTLGDLAGAVEQHWKDLRIEPVPWRTAPAIWRLLRETAAQGDSENIQPNLAGEVMRAILSGNRYPRTLFTSVITRIRADRDVNGLRAAILKACLIREEENTSVSLDRENLNRGYRLGRLFAVLDAAQYAGVGKVNAGIRDKYVSSASATPGRVFPLLLRGAQNHLASARKKGKGGRVHRLELDTTEIMSGLDATNPFPTIMPLSEQGHFFVGFYHQQADLKVPRQKDEAVDETESDNDATE